MNVLSMLYIDNPVGTGYSYQEQENPEDIITQSSYTEDLYQFVKQFYQLFPDSHSKELYIGGQSYAGKYVTALAYRIHQHISRGESNLPLTGIYMGGPFFAPEIMVPVLSDYFYNLGVLSRSQLARHKARTKTFLLRYSLGLLPRHVTTAEVCRNIFDRDFLWRDNFVTAEIPGYDVVQDIMISERIRQAVHVGNVPYLAINVTLNEKFGHDFLSSTREKLAALLDTGDLKVLIFNGDYDAITNTGAIEEAVLRTPWVGQADYANKSRHAWFLPSQSAEIQAISLAGFFTSARNLCRVIVHGAGHQVPHDQLDITRKMMEQFVHSGCVTSSTHGPP